MESSRRTRENSSLHAIRAKATCMCLSFGHSMPSTHVLSISGIQALNLTKVPSLASLTDLEKRKAHPLCIQSDPFTA